MKQEACLGSNDVEPTGERGGTISVHVWQAWSHGVSTTGMYCKCVICEEAGIQKVGFTFSFSEAVSMADTCLDPKVGFFPLN